ncbi:MAG: ATP-binding cassette domain-containing protein, partial [Thermoflexales bacterium]|nr:ATP-binding cassette domain-containing protein [Thermoflexales bacterium]
MIYSNTLSSVTKTAVAIGAPLENGIKMRAEAVSVFYGAFRAVAEVSLPIRERKITAIIGPSGCGKSTLLRAFNRMNDLVAGAR